MNGLANQIIIDGATVRPAPWRGLFSESFRWLSAAYLALGGWKVRGDWPGLDKAVLVAAPHTSNWDGVNMLATAGFYRVKLRWKGKKSLTQGPLGWFIKAMGCVPNGSAPAKAACSTCLRPYTFALTGFLPSLDSPARPF